MTLFDLTPHWHRLTEAQISRTTQVTEYWLQGMLSTAEARRRLMRIIN